MRKIAFIFLPLIFISAQIVAQPVITNQPGNQTVIWGSNATFNVGVTGTGPFAYQWRLNGTNLPNNIINTIAGGNLFDGLAATNTILNSPQGSAVDAAGNLYIADTYNHVVRRVDTNGLAKIIAGTGSAGYSGDGGAATNANLFAPMSVVLDGQGSLIIADGYNNRVRKVNTNGIITAIVGTGFPPITPSQSGNGVAATNAMLNIPIGLALDSSGNLYIADSSDNQIRKVNPSGVISTIANTTGAAGYNFDNSSAVNANINNPTDVAVDSTGNVYIADNANHRIRKINTSGTISTIAGTGVAGYSGDGASATAAKIKSPSGVSVDSSGAIYLVDSGNNCVRKITNGIIRTIAGTSTAGFSGDGGAGTSATFNFPASLSRNASNDLFIADGGNSRIRKLVTNGIITTVAGRILNDSSPATNGTLSLPRAIARDRFGNFFITDIANARIRKIDTNGMMTTCAGNGIAGFAGDGGAATNANLNNPYGVAVDSAGNLFIGEAGNGRVRKVDTNGLITTFAGTGSFVISGNGGAATNAGLRAWGVAVDVFGNVFITDPIFNWIRKIDTNGVITSVAGTGSFGHTGDGGAATNAKINNPFAICFNRLGEMFFTEWGAIRKVDTNGIITTYAGKGYTASGFSGDGGLATNAMLSSSIWGLWCDAAGNVFIGDSNNSRIRKVDTNQIISTTAGNGLQNFGGEGLAGNNLNLSMPSGLAGDSADNLFIVEYGSNRIRKLSYLEYADQPSYSVSNVTTNLLNNNYSVVITSTSGSVTSSVAALIVQLPPITPAFTASNGVCAFTWSAVSNLTYQLQSATNLTAPAWLDLGSPITATTNSVSVTNAINPDEQRFYRVRLWP